MDLKTSTALTFIVTHINYVNFRMFLLLLFFPLIFGQQFVPIDNSGCFVIVGTDTVFCWDGQKPQTCPIMECSLDKCPLNECPLLECPSNEYSFNKSAVCLPPTEWFLNIL
jgi:hypothetical protein